MSDDEDFMMSDAESYEFEYDDDEEVDVVSAAGSGGEEAQGAGGPSAQDRYYEAKGVKGEAPEDALELFRAVAQDPGADEEHRFKALKQMLKIEYKLGRFEQFSSTFRQLFGLDLRQLPKAYLEDSLSRILDNYISLPCEQELEFLEVLLQSYGPTSRLLLKAELKRVTVLIKLGRFRQVAQLLPDLYHKVHQLPDVTRNSYLLELYSVEIQVYSHLNDFTKLKHIYHNTLLIQSTISHPRINAIIKECGAKICMRDQLYEQATSEFYESFKNYDEIGNQSKRIQILKYLIISSILSKNEINKFESQETKFFLNESEIKKYIKLIKSFENLNYEEFLKVFNELVVEEKDDTFLAIFFTKIEEIMKLKILINYIKPFKKISMVKLSDYLGLSIDKLEEIFLKLKNNGSIKNVRLDLIDNVIYNNE